MKMTFDSCQMLQVQNAVYTFSWGTPVKVTRYSDLSMNDSVVKIDMGSLGVGLECFSLVNYQNKRIYMTGGCDRKTIRSVATVYSYDLIASKWN